MIRTLDLYKDYSSTRALNGVDLTVDSGSVYGLVGPNGAGKTTLLGVLSGLRSATAGQTEIGTDRIAMLPDTPFFDPWLTAHEVVALAHSMSGSTDVARIDELLELTGIADAADRAVGGFSRGMLQRLGLASTLVGGPQLVLLDEPCSALDPLGRREVLDLITRLRGEATVVFSSHILADVQEVCDTVGILREGTLIFQGRLQDLLVGHAVPRYLVRLRGSVEPVINRLREADWVHDVAVLDPEMIRVTAGSLEVAEAELVAVLAGTGAHVVSLVPEAPSLEDVFLEVVQ
ncbi:MAG: ABC transporter ATP-binding protein [Acidimicrobiia bacterium]|nr:ABC transporter ATP-binding protein [Acidimicrobiia bacterium]